MATLRISNKTYSYKDFLPFLYRSVKITIGSNAKKDIKKSYSSLIENISSGRTIYGVNTGFGRLSQIKIKEQDQSKLQLNLVRSHSAGVGKYLDAGIVRIIMALKVLNYSHGYSGVHPDTVDQLVKFINNEVLPAVPEKGSVGASGDLAQLAHIASSLIGEGIIFRGEKVVSSKNVLNILNI